LQTSSSHLAFISICVVLFFISYARNCTAAVSLTHLYRHLHTYLLPTPPLFGGTLSSQARRGRDHATACSSHLRGFPLISHCVILYLPGFIHGASRINVLGRHCLLVSFLWTSCFGN
jgi:hypothetical protein